MKVAAADVNARKAIDHLSCDEQRDGSVLGLLATTYELNPTFFETDFLPSCLGLAAADDRSWSSNIALQKALAGMDSASLFLDARRYRGRPSSLRIAVRPVVGEGGQVLHGKVSLLVQERAVRLLVGSNNLTDEGYRSNREVLLPITVREGQLENAGIIRQALESMPFVLAAWWTASTEELRQKALQVLTRLNAPSHTPGATFVWGGGATPLWKQVLELWPEEEPIVRVTIVSPFWSEEGGDGPIRKFLGSLRDRAGFSTDAELHLFAESTLGSASATLPRVPTSVLALDAASLGMAGFAHATDPGVTPAEAGGRTDVLQRRALHAKVMIIEGKTTTLAYVGSGNFTQSGWGFGFTKANIEAGVVLVREGAAATSLRSLVPRSVGDSIRLGSGAAYDLDVPAEEAPPQWPTFLKELVLTPNARNELELEARLFEGRSTSNFHIRTTDSGERVDLLRGGADQPLHRCELPPRLLERLLRAKEARVCWTECEEGVDFPINVDPSARLSLPLGDGHGRPGESLLLAYYQGKISFEDLYPPPLDPDGGESGAAVEPTDSEVDTSRIQSYQVREFVEALTGLEQDLTRAQSGTETSLRLALLGPVSPLSLARSIHEQALSGQRSATAAGFQLVEITAALRRVASAISDAEKQANFVRHSERVERELRRFLEEVRTQAGAKLGAGSSFDRYVNTLIPGTR